MTDRTKIEWCDSTFNPWIGCTKVSPACDHCYAERQDARGIFGGQHWGAGVPRKRTSAANWRKPLQWNSSTFVQCEPCGWRGDLSAAGKSGACPSCGTVDDYRPARRRVFCASLADVFDNAVPAQWRIELMRLILNTPHLDWLLLTKRIANATGMLETAFRACHAGREGWADNVLPNVWIGATICNQGEADRDIPKLLEVPASVRFLSIEPLLGSIDIGWALGSPLRIAGGFLQRGHFSPGLETLRAIDWVIVGGESGPNARPMHPDWVRGLRDQCWINDVPFLFKQWGEWLPSNAEDQPVYRGEHRYLGEHWHAFKVGKGAAGRLLDGVTHDGYPDLQP